MGVESVLDQRRPRLCRAEREHLVGHGPLSAHSPLALGGGVKWVSNPTPRTSTPPRPQRPDVPADTRVPHRPLLASMRLPHRPSLALLTLAAAAAAPTSTLARPAEALQPRAIARVGEPSGTTRTSRRSGATGAPRRRAQVRRTIPRLRAPSHARPRRRRCARPSCPAAGLDRNYDKAIVLYRERLPGSHSTSARERPRRCTHLGEPARGGGAALRQVLTAPTDPPHPRAQNG